jgi:hypothetical protein
LSSLQSRELDLKLHHPFPGCQLLFFDLQLPFFDLQLLFSDLVLEYEGPFLSSNTSLVSGLPIPKLYLLTFHVHVGYPEVV